MFSNSRSRFFTSLCQTFLLLSFFFFFFYCMYSILHMSMVGVNHLFNVMKAKKKEMLVRSFFYTRGICMFKVQVKKETFQSFYLA